MIYKRSNLAMPVLILVVLVTLGCVAKADQYNQQDDRQDSKQQNSFIVEFPDPNLEAVIRDSISKQEGDIFNTDLAVLVVMDASNREIQDLEGLQYCTNLEFLILAANQISDISPLSSLTKLTRLMLGITGVGGNEITDISPLADLTELKELMLNSNEIEDITPLADLINLERLELSENQIVDIGPLSGLENISELMLDSNEIQDVTPLAELPHITTIKLSENQISDLTPLLGNSSFGAGTRIVLIDNPLSDDSLDRVIPALEERGVLIWLVAPEGMVQ